MAGNGSSWHWRLAARLGVKNSHRAHQQLKKKRIQLEK
jgi:hypothetical protein